MTTVDIFTFLGVVLPVLSQFDAMLFALTLHHRYFGTFPAQTLMGIVP